MVAAGNHVAKHPSWPAVARAAVLAIAVGARRSAAPKPGRIATDRSMRLPHAGGRSAPPWHPPCSKRVAMGRYLCIVSRDDPLVRGYVSVVLSARTSRHDDVDIIVDRRGDATGPGMPGSGSPRRSDRDRIRRDLGQA